MFASTVAVQSDAPRTAGINDNVVFAVKRHNVSPPQYMDPECVPLNSHKLHNAEEEFSLCGLWNLSIGIFCQRS